jgi:hypothetical protein
VPSFAVRSSQLTPAAALPGNQANAEQLRQVSAAVFCAGDVLARLSGNSTGQGKGLRGGSFRIAHDASAAHVTLDQVRWTEDLAVSGKIDKPLSRTGTVRAALDFQATDGTSGRIAVQWQEGSALASAAIRGKIGAAAVVASQPAP